MIKICIFNAFTFSYLQWHVKDCDSNKYDGLLIRLGISCSIRDEEVNTSFIAFKIPGKFKGKIAHNIAEHEALKSSKTSFIQWVEILLLSFFDFL